MNIRKSKNFARVASVCLSMILVTQSFVFISTVYAEVQKDEYIVITNNTDGTSKLKQDYDVTGEEGNALTVELSVEDVAELENNKDIKCIEKDFTIESEAEAEWNMVKPKEENWNLKTINAIDAAGNKKVKIAVLDTGIDVTDNIIVKERKNFINESPVTTPLFEDLSGHGTSVASILAGSGTDSNVEGVNSNIDLYSARILDEKKQAAISRVVEAIYWAIEKKVDIINISFGTQTYSEALKTAVDAAIEKGILVVAAVGNRGNSGVDYPAAFNSVLAVGSINAEGKVSEFSSTGDEVDVVAPGEAVLAQGNFGVDLTLSGTSLAAPHVAGLAALLWSKDMSKPATFIKTLIKLSAMKMPDAGSGYGLVDYEYALQIYNEVAAQFETVVNGGMLKENNQQEQPLTRENDTQENLLLNESAKIEENVNEETLDDTRNGGNTEEHIADGSADITSDAQYSEEKQVEAISSEVDDQEFDNAVLEQISVIENSSQVQNFSDPVVDGSWKAAVHQAYYANAAMKAGAVVSDSTASGVKGMTSYSEFHGFSWHGSTDSGLNSGTCNYIANYKYLVLVANKVGSGGKYTSVANSDITGLSSTCYSKLSTGVGNIMKTTAYTTYTSATNKKAFLMGVAMHTATDAFAHSAFKQMQSGSYSWVRITHTSDAADDPSVVPKRVQMAYAVEKNVVSRYNGNRSGEKIGNDFHDDTGNCYKLPIGFRQNKIMTFAQAADVTKTSIISHFKLLQTGGN